MLNNTLGLVDIHLLHCYYFEPIEVKPASKLIQMIVTVLLGKSVRDFEE